MLTVIVRQWIGGKWRVDAVRGGTMMLLREIRTRGELCDILNALDAK